MNQITCPHCGRKYPEDATVCPGCRHPKEEPESETWCSEDAVLNIDKIHSNNASTSDGKKKTGDVGHLRQSTQTKILSRPEDNLGWSLVTAFLCFWPTGIAAAICSMKVDYFWFKGEKNYAIELAERAKRLRWISLGITLVVAFFVFVLVAATDGFD